MNKERKEALEEILQELAQNLDITESEDEDIRKSYEAVGTWLSDESSSLKDYDVEIRPQGSYNLGTTMLKTEDIHPPKTGISVHFSGSLV